MGILDKLLDAGNKYLTEVLSGNASGAVLPPAFERSTMLNGPGYSVRVPAGFTMLQSNPMGGYALLPPGSTPPPVSPAIIAVDPIPPMMVPMLMQSLDGFENPFVQTMNAMSLGLKDVKRVAPARQMDLPSGTAHIREFDAVSWSGQPVRMMVLVIQGQLATVKVVIGVNMQRWPEFIGPCMELVGGISLSGAMPVPAQVQAVLDKQHPDQIELDFVNPDNTLTPFLALPTQVEGRQVINNFVLNVDNSIRTGDIKGAGIAIGPHSLAKVS